MIVFNRHFCVGSILGKSHRRYSWWPFSEEFEDNMLRTLWDRCRRDSFVIGATLLCLIALSLGDRGSLGDICRSQHIPYQLSLLAQACIPRGWGQPCFHKKFQASLSFRVRYYLNIPPLYLKIEELCMLNHLRFTCPLADTVLEILTMAQSVPPSVIPSLCDVPTSLIREWSLTLFIEYRQANIALMSRIGRGVVQVYSLKGLCNLHSTSSGPETSVAGESLE